jgi:drug/metabolite transporter (DMT)-like permease
MKKSTFAAISLVAVAVSWGAAFVLMKDAIAAQPFYDFLAIRFTIAVAVMIAVRPSTLKKIDGPMARHGVTLGVILAFGYITQTIGLELTTAAITGFVTGLYVVLTPIFGWLIFRQKVGQQVVWGVALATVALALISISGFSIEAGQLWVMLSAVLFAAHIVGLSIWSPGKDVYTLTVMQLAAVGSVSWIGALVDGGYQSPPDLFGWVAVLFTAVFSTAVAFLVQTWAQSIMDASRVAILLTSEVLWAALIAVAVGQEVLGLKTIIGGAIMVAAMLIVEWPTKLAKAQVVQPRLID